MAGFKNKIYLAIMTGMLVGGWTVAAELTPPQLPVLYYGTVSINSELAATSPVISMRRKADGREIASTTALSNGKYFAEMPCADYLNQAIIFRIGALIAHEAACVDAMAVPSVRLDLNFSSAGQTVENDTASIVIPASIGDLTQAKIKLFSVATSTASTTAVLGAAGMILIRESADPPNKFIVTFSPHTVITGSSAWNGTLIAPTLSTVSLNIPADPNFRSEAEKIISLGYGGESLIFSQPVSILFPGQAKKQIGFSSGADFTEIKAICPENSASSLTATTTKECKFNGPADLTVWTKHFTYFAVYRQVYVPPPSRGGGGISLPEIKPSLATTTKPENSASSALPAAEPVSELKAEPPIAPRVLGVKYYANGTLIRGHDNKIYLIERGQLTVIRTLAQLTRYKGQKIYDVPDEVVRQYLPFFNGQLIRGSDKKIYIISKNKKQYLKNLAELKKYAGQKINNVSDEILKKY